MPFNFDRLEIPDVVLITPVTYHDKRGLFAETYKRSEFVAQGIDDEFVQENHSRSHKGVLRGLHYQKRPKAQGKLVRVVVGRIFDVAADLRIGSPTYGTWVGVNLSADNRQLLYIPPWCLHGFLVLSDEAEVVYKVTEEYAPLYEAGVIWSDPDLGIEWPDKQPILAPRDQSWPRLQDAESNFEYVRSVP